MITKLDDAIETEIKTLSNFMTGIYSVELCKMQCYFSLGGKYCHPRELKEFWDSLTQGEKEYYVLAIWEVF